MTDALVGAAMFAWAPFLCAVVGVMYFVSSRQRAPLGQRLLTAAYAPVAALLYLATALRPPALLGSSTSHLYAALLLVPLILLVVSLRSFPGPRFAHFVLAPLALVCMLWQGVLSWLFIYGK